MYRDKICLWKYSQLNGTTFKYGLLPEFRFKTDALPVIYKRQRGDKNMGEKKDFRPLKKYIINLREKGYSVQEICDYITKDLDYQLPRKRGKKKLKCFINRS